MLVSLQLLVVNAWFQVDDLVDPAYWLEHFSECSPHILTRWERNEFCVWQFHCVWQTVSIWTSSFCRSTHEGLDLDPAVDEEDHGWKGNNRFQIPLSVKLCCWPLLMMLVWFLWHEKMNFRLAYLRCMFHLEIQWNEQCQWVEDTGKAPFNLWRWLQMELGHPEQIRIDGMTDMMVL